MKWTGRSVDAIDLVMSLEEFCVLACAARNIEYRARAGYNLADQRAQAVTFTRVVLEMIDRVVKLRAVYEHAGSRHVPAPLILKRSGPASGKLTVVQIA
jgi:hypothetical protein